MNPKPDRQGLLLNGGLRPWRTAAPQIPFDVEHLGDLRLCQSIRVHLPEPRDRRLLNIIQHE
jgi:hypothetical protein